MSTPRSAWRATLGSLELDQVAERDPHLDPQAAELARIAHEDPDVLAALEQLRDQGPAHGPGRACHQDHAGTL